jgi:methylated-DNA-[protein]-cysteine S-methyltransferase
LAPIYYGIFDSSLGNLVLVSNGESLIRLEIKEDDEYMLKKRLRSIYPSGIESSERFSRLCSQLDRYLKGEPVTFDVKIDISSEADFIKRVLYETKKIPYGETRSYQWISHRIGHKNAARAVGQALKKNPIPIVIPCHRVIRNDAGLGGFSSGIAIKKRLLSLEGVHIGSDTNL